MLSDDDLLQSDIESRAAALDVERSAIVQAPAGSGKTELLIQRFLRLLAVVDRPEEILAITFTKKAACEMQNRVTAALRRARDGGEPEEDYQRITFSAAQAALARDTARGWNLIRSPGRMRIQTVDAFGAGLARALPLSSGLGGIGTTVTGAEMTGLYRSAAAATLDSLRYDTAFGAAVERVLTHLDNRTGLYVSHLARMLAYRDQWLAITGGGIAGSDEDTAVVRERLESNIARIVARQLASLRRQMGDAAAERLLALLRHAAANLLDGGDDQHAFCAFADTVAMPDEVEGRRLAWQAIAGLLLTKGGDWRKTINKNDGFPPGDDIAKQELYDLITELRDIPGFVDGLRRVRTMPPVRYADEQWDVLLALLTLLPLAVGELQRLFGERGISDHIEVALAASQSLGTEEEPGEIALALDYTIRHLLIDEMQDTSISQYAMLTKLTAGWTQGDGRTLFCVGDPMQSIYRFRDAEVAQFLLAREQGIGDVQLDSLLLRRNFRSGENLVHWFNTVFGLVFPAQDDLAAGAIAYSASVPVEAHAGSGEYSVHPLFAATAEDEARHSLGVIRDCLAEFPDDDIAVLVRSRTNLPELLHELRGAGISYQALEIDRLTDLPEIIDLLALTRALCHEADRLAWLSLLRGPWVGLTWQDLHALVRNDARQTVRELLRDPLRLAAVSSEGVLQIAEFRRRLANVDPDASSGSLRERVERSWYALGGPCLLQNGDQLDNVYRYFDVIEKIETAGNVPDIRELEYVLDQERVSSRGNSACRLQVMTMHKAKGLEFDHVVLHGLGRLTRSSDRAVLSWTSESHAGSEPGMIISPVGPQSEIENDPLHQFIESIERDKERFEMDRLLYVSCTRARKSLHLVGNVEVAADGQSFRNPAASTLLHRLWPAVESVYRSAFAAAAAEDAERFAGDAAILVRPALRRMTASPPGEAPALPARPGGIEDSGGDAATRVSYDWVGATARHAGTLVHRWLQYLSEGKASIDAAGIDDTDLLTRNWARRLGVAADDLDGVCSRVLAALRGIATDEKAQWLLNGKGMSEYPVSGVFEGRVQSIVIDRLRIDESGAHWIVDYKTGTHEGGNLAGFLEQEAERHRPQLQKYRTMYANLTGATIRTALYFPLLQEFLELDPPAGGAA